MHGFILVGFLSASAKNALEEEPELWERIEKDILKETIKGLFDAKQRIERTTRGLIRVNSGFPTHCNSLAITLKWLEVTLVTATTWGLLSYGNNVSSSDSVPTFCMSDENLGYFFPAPVRSRGFGTVEQFDLATGD